MIKISIASNYYKIQPLMVGMPSVAVRAELTPNADPANLRQELNDFVFGHPS